MKDSELSILEYWQKNRFAIANRQHWMCRGEDACKTCDPEKCCGHCTCEAVRENACGTLRSYGRYISQLSKYLKDKPISECSLEDINFALANIKKRSGAKYNEATLESIQSVLRILFTFAANHGDAYNIMKGLRVKTGKGSGGKFAGVLNIIQRAGGHNKAIVTRLEEELEKLPFRTKSLNIQQMEKLVSILWSRVLADGRVMLPILILYAGVRPAEGRALCWQDIVPLRDHSGCFVINIHRIRDRRGKIIPIPKTDNAFRRIPVHPGALEYLKKRKHFVEEQNPGKDIGELPICCFGNEFARPCKDYEAALMADEILSQIKISTEEMYVYAICRELDMRKKDGYGDQQLTLYVLRRNFWTWMMSLSKLTDMEKRFVMGHSMVLDGEDLRPLYNDENLLYEIWEKMSRCVVDSERHEYIHTVNLGETVSADFLDVGLLKIVAPEEFRVNGGKLRMHLITSQQGDGITMKDLSGCVIISNDEVRRMPPLSKGGVVNNELAEWNAHMKLKPGSASANSREDKYDVVKTERTDFTYEKEAEE